MPVQRVYAHPKVADDRGRVALMRGPLVYCLEADDNDADILNVALPVDAELTAERRGALLEGVTVIRGKGLTADKTPLRRAFRPSRSPSGGRPDNCTTFYTVGF